ncbi:hypothetical protein [Desulfosarcina ovata]|uniref:Uncharacterized protein n=1 Tax=Desulfosarcina ovata subsp. ovata TaxID=2752305 RepID=A0A5K8AEM3_9BACT|nr:hypothetical protein [Desulfosarcina ovata]BBO91021.1 hypothetical protein DSCOOX_42010 [Desulfosarcina ovata subsp. ovata]
MTDSKSDKTRPDSARWLFLTNQMNLQMMLAAGLLMSREGFGDKYYRDLLDDCPGWIPLFPNTAPRALVDRVVAEARHLTPVAVEVDISALAGPAKTVSVFGSPQDITLPEVQGNTAEILLVPAPLPLSLIKKIYFKSAADKTAFINRARSQYRNVPEAWFAKASGKKWFAGQSTCTPGPIAQRETVPGSMARAQALGGTFALLFHLANRSDTGSRYYQWLTGTTDDSPEVDPILTFFPAWLRREAAFPPDKIQVKLFWTLVNDIVSAQAGELSRDVVLESIQREIEQLDDPARERYRESLCRLCDDLKALRGLSDDTLDALFQRHPRTFSRALILFFLMNSGRELLAFAHAALAMDDVLAAAILFGAREGWIDLAVDLRHGKRFADDMALRMARACHHAAASGLTVATEAPPALPLRTLLRASGEEQRQQKRIAAAMLEIARRQKWDCIETTIRLPKGQYQLVVEPGSTRLVLDGDVKTVQASVRQELFWEAMSQLPLPLPDALERLARKTVE